MRPWLRGRRAAAWWRREKGRRVVEATVEGILRDIEILRQSELPQGREAEDPR
jgi:hypothetical protein